MSKKAEKSCRTEGRDHCQVEYDDEVEYYVKAFKRLNKTGKHTWNWAAFLFGGAWMAYRKMYLYALFFVLIIVVFRLCAFLLISFSMYGTFLSPDLFENQHPVLYQSIIVCSWGICCIFTGYFGNALYYRAIKKKIRKGYHLLQKYHPISIVSALYMVYSPFICFADWISRKFQLKTKIKNEINEETIRAYLNPNKENHLSVKIANVFVCFLLIAGIAKKAIDSYKKAETQITTEKKSNF